MIQRVYERAQRATLLSGVLVATPDAAIVAAVEAFGGNVVLTSSAHRTGTDRVAEAARTLPPGRDGHRQCSGRRTADRLGDHR